MKITVRVWTRILDKSFKDRTTFHDIDFDDAEQALNELKKIDKEYQTGEYGSSITVRNPEWMRRINTMYPWEYLQFLYTIADMTTEQRQKIQTAVEYFLDSKDEKLTLRKTFKKFGSDSIELYKRIREYIEIHPDRLYC